MIIWCTDYSLGCGPLISWVNLVYCSWGREGCSQSINVVIMFQYIWRSPCESCAHLWKSVHKRERVWRPFYESPSYNNDNYCMFPSQTKKNCPVFIYKQDLLVSRLDFRAVLYMITEQSLVSTWTCTTGYISWSR